ncbi:MAG: thioredoxin domain-containing protein [Actinomycetes bacterium]
MSSKESKRSAREQLAEQRRQQAAADKRKQTITNTIIVVVVVVVVVGLFVAVQSSRTKAPASAALPATVTAQGGGVPFGTGPVTVDVWEDFQCPACKQFEATNADTLKQQALANQIKLVVHPLSFLDAPTKLNNTSSVRAANAFACAAGTGEQQTLDFHQLLYQKQPAENPGTEAWSDDDLIAYAKSAGITGSQFESCVKDGTYNAWVQQIAAAGVDAGISSTPTVYINGNKVDDKTLGTFFTDPKALPAAITAASQS